MRLLNINKSYSGTNLCWEAPPAPRCLLGLLATLPCLAALCHLFVLLSSYELITKELFECFTSRKFELLPHFNAAISCKWELRISDFKTVKKKKNQRKCHNMPNILVGNSEKVSQSQLLYFASIPIQAAYAVNTLVILY